VFPTCLVIADVL